MVLTKFVWNVPLLPTAIVPVPPTIIVDPNDNGSLLPLMSTVEISRLNPLVVPTVGALIPETAIVKVLS